MAQFVNKDSGLGFDAGPTGAVPWQMVPLGGARGIKLLDGAKLEIQIEPAPNSGGTSGGLTYSEVDVPGSKREIWLQGRKPGEYWVSAVSPNTGAVVAWLATQVFALRQVKIAYYFLPGSRRFDTKVLTDRVNTIFYPQAHVQVESLGSWANQFGETVSLPREIDIEDSVQRNQLLNYGNHHQASALVYFGWKIKNNKDRTAALNAITLGRTVLIDSFKRQPSEMARLARTLAHEIGHVISDDQGPQHDGKADDLMYADGGRKPGTHLRRTRVIRLSRPLAV